MMVILLFRIGHEEEAVMIIDVSADDIVFQNNTCECIAHLNKHTTELLNTRRAAVTYYMMENLLYL